MGRIKDKTLYPDDPHITLDDYVIGSDIDNNGKTQNYPIRAILALIESSGTIVEPTPQPIITLRASQKLQNLGDDVNSWRRELIEPDTSLHYRISRIEVTFKNIADFENPILLLYKYSPSKRKNKDHTTDENSYSRSSYKFEETQTLLANDRVNEFPLTSQISHIDILPEKYFVIEIDPTDPTVFNKLQRKGGNRHSKKIRDTNQGGAGNVQVKQRFAIKLRYTKDGATVETDFLKYFTTVCVYSKKERTPIPPEETPVYGIYKRININHELL